MNIPEDFYVVNVGAELFATELNSQGVETMQLEWTPATSVEQQRALAMLEILIEQDISV